MTKGQQRAFVFQFFGILKRRTRKRLRHWNRQQNRRRAKYFLEPITTIEGPKWKPRVMCPACGFFYDEEPGIYNFAQNLGDTCRQFGCFGNMISFDSQKQAAIAAEVAARNEQRRKELEGKPAPWPDGQGPKTFYDFIMGNYPKR